MTIYKNMGNIMAEAATDQQYQIDRLKQAQILRDKNIAFFKQFHPPIYERYKDYKLKEYQVSLNTELDQFDLLYKGKSVYNNHPIAEAHEELACFEEQFAPGKPLVTIHPPFGGYVFPRYFHQKCMELIKLSPLKENDYKGYKIPDFYPLMIFNGVGSGYQIELFLKKYKILNCLIVEPHPELFSASLYLIDWEELCQPFLDHPERNIHFILGPIEDEYHLYGYCMRYLSAHCPLYPLTTLFINHKGIDLYKRVTDKLCDDTYAFVSVWGFYDDEINQINNCIHNLHLKTPIIQCNRESLLELPIFIVGAGPSLDERIEDLKRFKGKALIVSCGTAIHPLYKNGIKPDIHFELESHLVTLKSLEELGAKDWIRSIPVMGPAQLSPRLYQYFDKQVIYFKGESVTSFLFGDEDSSVTRGTPTCTNGALALFAHWGFKRIFLFGMDFGYRDFKNHHASGSIYYTTNDKDMLEDANVENIAKIPVKAVDGTEIKTKPILYTAMRTAETTAKSYSKFCTFYNCSNGAAMGNTEWVKPGTFPIEPANIEEGMIDRFISIQYDHEDVYDTKKIHRRLDIINHNMKEVAKYMEGEINKTKPNLYSLTSTINNITSFIESKIKPELPPFYFFIRGTIWHIFYIGYSHALGIHCKKDRAKWIKIWKKHSVEIMHGIHDHFCSIVYKEYDYELDLWTQRSTSDPED